MSYISYYVNLILIIYFFRKNSKSIIVNARQRMTYIKFLLYETFLVNAKKIKGPIINTGDE